MRGHDGTRLRRPVSARNGIHAVPPACGAPSVAHTVAACEATATVYRALLGDSYELLPPVLRRFHDLPLASGQGTLRVTHGASAAARLLARLLRLPAACESTPVILDVRTVENTQVWTRSYGELLLVTRQWQRGGLLIEQAGPYRAGFRLRASPGGLKFEFARGWLGPIPIPSRLALRIDAEATTARTLCSPEPCHSWWIDARVSAPFVGLIARYEGEVRPLWKQP